MNACIPHQELVNFQGAEDEFPLAILETIKNEPIQLIEPDDRLSIRVTAFNPEAVKPFNQDPNGGNGATGGGIQGNNISPLYGYIIDEDGMLDYPIIGAIHAKGRTIEQLKAILLDSLDNYIETPVLDMRYLNRQITIVGEVRLPGVVDMKRNRVTIFDALQLAGGMTDYSKRDNILVIREKEGQRTYGRLDFKEKNLFQSPFYYLCANDIVYVEPLRAKTSTVEPTWVRRYLGYFSSLLGVTSIVLTLTRL